MVNNSLVKTVGFLKRLLVYSPPENSSRFVLEEAPDEREVKSVGAGKAFAAPELDEFRALLRYARRLQSALEKTAQVLKTGKWPEKAAVLKNEYNSLRKQQAALEPIIATYTRETADISSENISTSLEENRRIIESLYCLPINKDVVVREITLALAQPVKVLLIFLDGLVNNQVLNDAVLKPLLKFGNGNSGPYGDDLVDRISRCYLPNNQVNKAVTFESVQIGINSGDASIFFDGASQALLVNSKGWEHRGVNRPISEQTVRGSQAAFSENLRVNTAQVRTILRSSDLVTEMYPLGTRSRINCAVMYLKSVANPTLVAEVRRRINNIETDYINDSGVLEQFIQDQSILPLPQSLSTERPDRVAANLAEGRVGIILEGSPFAHVVPVSFFTFFHSGEDFSLHPVGATFLRLLRLLGALVSVLLPSIYIAITYFHQEALPTELIIAIAGARENVPFPALFEVVMMELAFELIREAGLRIPGMLGSTIGIVGAIVLGQAAVIAHIVSPIIVIVVAITGLAGSIIPEYRMALVARLARFMFLVMAATWGLVGVATALLISTVALCQFKSFGVPYMTPIGPKTDAGFDMVVRGPVYRQEARPDELSTKDVKKQPAVSRRWTEENPAGEEES